MWNETLWNRDLLGTIKRFIALRKKYAALRRGDFATLYAKGHAYAFARHLPGETIIVALNAGHNPVTFDLPVPNATRLIEEWIGEEMPVQDGYVRRVHLPAREGRVWVAKI